MEAAVWASQLECNSIIEHLDVGALFRFPNDDMVMLYHGRGWYSNPTHPRNPLIRFKTEMNVGVIRIN